MCFRIDESFGEIRRYIFLPTSRNLKNAFPNKLLKYLFTESKGFLREACVISEVALYFKAMKYDVPSMTPSLKYKRLI